MTDEEPEIEQLEHTAAWRRRQLDANPNDSTSAPAISLIESLIDDLRRNDHTALRTELQSLTNWLGESDAISDYADLATDYRARIGVSSNPPDAASYLLGLLAIARSLV